MSSHAKVGDMEGAETWLLGMIDTWSQDIVASSEFEVSCTDLTGIIRLPLFFVRWACKSMVIWMDFSFFGALFGLVIFHYLNDPSLKTAVFFH